MIDSRLKRNSSLRRVILIFLALIGWFLCYRLIVDAAKGGLSRLFTTVAIVQPGISAADTAVRLGAKDPEAHYTRAIALVNHEQLEAAALEFQQAIQLRPHHYYEWLDLGVTLDRLNDQDGAVSALRESVRLAPSFAQPRWQLGNVLYRQGKYQEAFDELRIGAASNPALFYSLLELAWVAANGNVSNMENLIKPQNPPSHLGMALFLALHEKGADAARHAKQAGPPANDSDRALLNQTIDELLSTRQFADAYTAWAATHKSRTADGGRGPDQISNGNFLDPIAPNDSGFSWQLSPSPNVAVSIDPVGPSKDSRSVYFYFSGESARGTQFLSQRLLVQPNTRYSVSFATRTQELVTGGPPVISILDITSEPVKILGQSTALPVGTNEWKVSKADFSTGENTVAIIIGLQRLNCSQDPCPIFGRLWLSQFSLSKP